MRRLIGFTILCCLVSGCISVNNNGIFVGLPRSSDVVDGTPDTQQHKVIGVAFWWE